MPLIEWLPEIVTWGAVEKQGNIIVLKSFGSTIEANIAKTKLDAYGIPCFLTEENLASLYPLQNQRFSVRLHIFEQDRERAQEVLNEQVPLPDEEPICCPRCRSVNIESGLFPPKTISRCRDCGLEF